MHCARVMRGRNSMVKAATPASASALTSSSWPYGSIAPTTTAPALRFFASVAPGRRTLRTMSAAFSIGGAVLAIVAPAAA